MEKSSLKNDIYKIIKYRTKFSEATTNDQKDLYARKINQHVNILEGKGVQKEIISRLMTGGVSPVDILIEARDTVNASISNLQTKLSNPPSKAENEKVMNEFEEKFKLQASNLDVAKTEFKTLSDNYEKTAMGTLNLMNDIKSKVDTLDVSSAQGNLGDLKNKLTDVFSKVKSTGEMAAELSATKVEEDIVKNLKKKRETDANIQKNVPTDTQAQEAQAKAQEAQAKAQQAQQAQEAQAKAQQVQAKINS
jgi:hypothetical protein